MTAGGTDLITWFAHGFTTGATLIAAFGAWTAACQILRRVAHLEHRIARLEQRPTRVELPTGVLTADIHLSETDVARLIEAFQRAQARPVPPWGTPGAPPTGTGEEGRTTSDPESQIIAAARRMTDVLAANADLIEHARRITDERHAVTGDLDGPDYLDALRASLRTPGRLLDPDVRPSARTVNQARRAAGLPHYPDPTHLRRRY